MSENRGSGGIRKHAAPGACLRICKAFIRGRLARGPPPPDIGWTGNSGDGAQNFDSFWPTGRRSQCEELRKVREIVLLRSALDTRGEIQILNHYSMIEHMPVQVADQ